MLLLVDILFYSRYANQWSSQVDKDKSVDIDNPPHTQTFDPANRKSSLLT